MNKRIRHHIDPLKCRIRLTREDWIWKYQTLNSSVALDMGCGNGEFIADLALLYPDKFFVGVEIRDKMADKYFGKYEKIPNLALLVGNINLSLTSMFAHHKLDSVYINFPDPYSKKRKQKKRRMITGESVAELYEVMNSSARILLQTDEQDLFNDMHACFARVFCCKTSASRPELVENRTGAQSAWEKECIRTSRTIYRATYQKL